MDDPDGYVGKFLGEFADAEKSYSSGLCAALPVSQRDTSCL